MGPGGEAMSRLLLMEGREDGEDVASGEGAVNNLVSSENPGSCQIHKVALGVALGITDRVKTHSIGSPYSTSRGYKCVGGQGHTVMKGKPRLQGSCDCKAALNLANSASCSITSGPGRRKVM